MSISRTLLIARPRAAWSRQLTDQLGPTHGLAPTWTAPTIPAALAELDNETPDLVIVLQETPDQFSAHVIQQLLSTWPLTRVIVCRGPWCAGDGRNRDAWPLATAVSYTSVDDRLADEQRLLHGRGDGLPWTAGRDEIAAADFAGNPSPPRTDFTFRVVSPDPAWAHTITDQLIAVRGITSSEPDADLLLIDADPWDTRRLQDVVELLGLTTPRAVLLLTNSPDAISLTDINATLTARPHRLRLVVHDKLAAASRPATLAASLDTTPAPARRSA